MEIHRKKLFMSLSHELPLHVCESPLYDSVVSRLAAFVRSNNRTLRMVDIGANIGDTVIAGAPQAGDKILAIEPNPFFFRYLEENLKDCAASVHLIERAVGRREMSHSLSMRSDRGGTARFTCDENAAPVHFADLQTLATDAVMTDCNLLKIDTDGYDIDCINGALDFIERSHPAILFEADLFGNEEYATQVLDVLERLRSIGYQQAILYTHRGALFGVYQLTNVFSLLSPLFYQTSGAPLYYDILVLKDAQPFVCSELTFHCQQANNELSQRNALVLRSLILSTLDSVGEQPNRVRSTR